MPIMANHVYLVEAEKINSNNKILNYKALDWLSSFAALLI